MPVTFRCTTCQKKLTVSRKLSGKKIRCKDCSGVMRVPDVPPSGTPTQPAPAAPPAPIAVTPVVAQGVDDLIPVQDLAAGQDDLVPIQQEWVVECDDCGREHRPDEKLMGKRVRCKCGAILHLSENPNSPIALEPLDPAIDPLGLPPMPASGTTVQAAPAAWQAPPPAFGGQTSRPESVRDRRRREAEAMVRDADDKQRWRSKLKESADDDDEEWGPIGKMVGGGAMIIGGSVWAFLAWQEGVIYPYSFILILIGVFSLIAGVIESLT